MSKIKIAINGFGRIGRNVFKIAAERSNFEIVGINDLTSTKVLAHLLKYDSTQGRFNGTVSYDENSITVNGNRVPVTAERSPINIKWAVTLMLLLNQPVFSVPRKAVRVAMATT